MNTEPARSLLETCIASAKNREVLLTGLRLISHSDNDFTDKAYELLWRRTAQKAKLTDLLRLIKTDALLWNSPELESYRHKEVEQDTFIENPFEVEEGVLECKCGSKRVFSFQKQTKSSDEPMTTFAQCAKCGSKWKYSG